MVSVGMWCYRQPKRQVPQRQLEQGSVAEDVSGVKSLSLSHHKTKVPGDGSVGLFRKN